LLVILDEPEGLQRGNISMHVFDVSPYVACERPHAQLRKCTS
jgi:hypothetical protein